MTDLLLVDDEPMQEAVLFAEVVELMPGVVDFDWLTATEMPQPWLLGGESAMRAQVRLLSGRSDVTAWTADAGRKLADVLKQPVGSHRTLLGLDDDVDGQPPTVGLNVADAANMATSPVSAEGDGEPSLP